VPEPGRPPDVTTLTPGELHRTRRELAGAQALARPGSPAHIPIRAHLAAIDAELASRAGQQQQRPEDDSREEPGSDAEQTRTLRVCFSGTGARELADLLADLIAVMHEFTDLLADFTTAIRDSTGRT
jgi:hypothetical protein